MADLKQAIILYILDVMWGTSRTPDAYPAITEYPLIELRLEDPASIAAFASAIGAATGGRVDVLINNAAQFVLGTATPTDPATFDHWAKNSALALQVVYLGHRVLTAAMLGLMQHSGYRRILFTASVAAFVSGADVASDFSQPYTAGKRAIADFANSLRDWFSRIGLDIGVATVNPLATHTDIMLGRRPIFLEPVDGNGNPDPASPLAAVVPIFRSVIESGQPPTVRTWVGAKVEDRYALLTRSQSGHSARQQDVPRQHQGTSRLSKDRARKTKVAVFLTASVQGLKLLAHKGFGLWP